MDAVQQLRVRAEILHHRALSGDDVAIQRLTKASRSKDSKVRRRDCLAVLAAELGFANWAQAKLVLAGAAANNYGTLLCPAKAGGYLNLWFKTREEAIHVQNQRGGWLLAYRHQFFVVERSYIEALGLDPHDSAWTALSFDWTTLGASAARANLYSQLVSQLPEEGRADIGTD
jgi:hypothetical protein